MVDLLEKFFLRRFTGTSAIRQKRARFLMLFVLVISASIVVITAAMLALSVYRILSVQAAVRGALLVIGAVTLMILRSGRYNAAANFVSVGATIAVSVQIYFSTHSSPVDVVTSIVIPYLFIITAALLSGVPTVITVSLLTVGIGAAAIFNSGTMDPGMARKVLAIHGAMTTFITVLCLLIRRNMLDSIRTISQEMKTNEQQSAVIIDILGKVRGLSVRLHSSADTLTSTARGFSDNAQSQASSIEEMTASIEEISAGVDSISRSTDLQMADMEQLMEKMAQFSEIVAAIKSDVQKMLGNAAAITEHANTGNRNLEIMNRSMENINASSGEMTGIINIINDISDQINLLSLNAAIEAARAGDAGRGFAVVADEISKLADRTSESVKSIGNLITANDREIEGGRGSVQQTVETIGRILEGVNANYGIMQSIADRMDLQLKTNEEINRDSQEMKSQTSHIKTATSEHKSAIDEIVKTVSLINEMTQSNSAGAEETFSHTEELLVMADQLRDMVESRGPKPEQGPPSDAPHSLKN